MLDRKPTIAPGFRALAHDRKVAYRFMVDEREQRFLLLPDMRD